MKVHGKNHVYDYVPDFGDNRKLPREEMIVLGLKVVPAAEWDNYQRTVYLNNKKFTVDKAQELSEARLHQLVEEKFVSCEGLEIEGVEGEITFDVLYHEVPDLANEVINVIRSTELLTAGELKNFSPECDGLSSAPAPRQKATTAKPAARGKGK